MHSIKERNTVYVLKSDSNFGIQQVSNWATGMLNSEKILIRNPCNLPRCTSNGYLFILYPIHHEISVLTTKDVHHKCKLNAEIISPFLVYSHAYHK